MLAAPVYNTTGPSLYGNDVKLRNSFFQTGANKAWVDHLIRLPAGVLKKYFFYVHNTSLSGTVDISLQIWRLVTDARYTLVWQKIVSVDLGEYRREGALFEVDNELLMHIFIE